MAYKIDGSVLSDEMETLAGAEVMELLGPLFPKAKTDEDGKFSLMVGSPNSEIQISLFGYITVVMTAKDFMELGYAELVPAVNVSGNKKDSNVLLYGVVAASIIAAIYFANRKVKPAPKQIKIA